MEDILGAAKISKYFLWCFQEIPDIFWGER